ncbi:MAG TPA: alpha/beta hydrolase [Candidatus Acidoferrales bacterium]|nr:alpha/beta hydrolase [Candidatus Acidoferrales bacterium]
MLKHRFANLGDVNLHYAAAGEGGLVLFAHGFPEFWYAWKNQLEDFGRTHLAVAPDLRGYNLSSKPERVEHYHLEKLVADIAGLAHHFGRNRFTLVGHDWGGLIAWAFALANPDALEGLVIVNAPHPATFFRELRENPAQQQASAYIQLFRSQAVEGLFTADNYQRLIDIVLQPGLRQGYFTEEDKRAYLEAWSQPGAITGGLNYYRAAPLGMESIEGPQKASDFLPGLNSWVLEVPTLVIWGEKDEYLLTGILRGLEEFVPNITVRLIPDGSHWVIHEQPALVNQTIREWMNTLPRGKSA